MNLRTLLGLQFLTLAMLGCAASPPAAHSPRIPRETIFQRAIICERWVDRNHDGYPQADELYRPHDRTRRLGDDLQLIAIWEYPRGQRAELGLTMRYTHGTVRPERRWAWTLDHYENRPTRTQVTVYDLAIPDTRMNRDLHAIDVVWYLDGAPVWNETITIGRD